MERRITAIVAADMVGFSRLVEFDETGTLERQKRHFAELIEPAFDRHNGNIIKTMGDGLIAEFPSVVDAVQCCVHVQREMVARETDIPEGLKIRYRVGINLGDVIFDHGDVFGDGVNVAARLEGFAEPGGIVVSGTAYDMLKANVEVGYEDLGEKQVKNIATPVRVYRVLLKGSVAPVARVQPERRSGRGPFFAAALVALLAVVGGVFWALGWLAPDRGAWPDQRRIAVLPFANVSADPEDTYFSDGLTEEMISRLSRIDDLRVIARTSAMQYKDTDKGVDQIGRELSVGTVLEGSVRKSGDRVRITAQLIDVASQEHLWSAEFERELKDVFAIQTEISGSVAEALKLTLGSGLASGPANMEAYTLYLRGRYLLLNDRSAEGDRKAERFFNQALAADPEYAPALAGLARVSTQAVWTRSLPASEAYPKAKAMAERALALDTNLADAWYALALAEVDYFWDWEAGERAIKRALAIDPNHVLTLSFYAHRLLSTVYGRYDEAVATMDRAVKLDPLSLQANNRFVLVLWHAGQLDRAIKMGRQTTETWSSFMFPHMGLSWSYSAKGMHYEAVEEMLKAVDVSKRAPYALGYLVNTYARAGRMNEAQAIFDELEQRAKTTRVSAAAFAPAYAGLGDADKMFEVMEQMYDERHPEMMFIEVGETYARYHSDPRFIEFMNRVGLPRD